MSGADLFALRWLDAVIAVPVWLMAAGSLILAAALLLLLRSRLRWLAAPTALIALVIGGGVWLHDTYARGGRADALAAKLTNWRTQALASQPVLACIDTEVDPTVDAACERALFSRPEHLAAATTYVAQSINLLADAQQYTGARGIAFDREFDRLRGLLERDRFGLVANLLVMEEGCTAHSCDTLLLFNNPVQVQDNIARRTFQKHVAQHLDESGPRPAPVAARPSESGPATAGAAVAAPLPSDYVLPSASSIPPISIMNDEGSAPAAAATPRTAPANGTQKPPAPRRTAASNAVELKPLSLSQ